MGRRVSKASSSDSVPSVSKEMSLPTWAFITTWAKGHGKTTPKVSLPLWHQISPTVRWIPSPS
jgi:hypothetical protein